MDVYERHYMATLCEILLTIAQKKMGIRESILFRTSYVDKDNENVIDYSPQLLFALKYIFKFTKNAPDCLESWELDYSGDVVLLEVLQEKLTKCKDDSPMRSVWGESENICREFDLLIQSKYSYEKI